MAPFAGSAMGEYFLFNGKHALCMYDDLSKHADAYRQMSLLLRRPPGREAFPGDVFYLHSRLLERACKLSDDLGGGSLTALPIIETQAGDVAAYIPTNVISITDGQIFLESDLFFSGVRPAINVGISVSRVGGERAGRRRCGRSPAACGSTSPSTASWRRSRSSAPSSTRRRSRRSPAASGWWRRSTSRSTSPWPLEEQVVAIYAGVNGYLDDVPVSEVPRFQEELREHLRAEGSILAEIRDEKELSDELAEKLNAEMKKFADGFYVEEKRRRLAAWPRSRTSGGGSAPSATRARSRRRSSSSPRPACAARRRGSRRCGRTPTGCWS